MTEPVDLAWAVQTAIYTVASAAIAPVPVLDSLPDPANWPPLFAYFGDNPVQEIGGKGSSLEQQTPSIHVMGAGSSREDVKTVQAKLKAALHEQPIAADGTILSNPVQQSSNCQQVELSAYLGTQTFLIFAQPAG